MVSAPIDQYGGDSIGAYAAGVESYLRSLDHPALLGTSWGGLVSLTAAKGVADHLSALVLTGAFARNTAIPRPFGFMRGVIPAIQAAAPSFAPLSARVVGGRGIDASARLELTREAREVSVAERKRRLEAVFGANLLDDLQLLDVPTIVIHGTRDHLVTRRDARELANRLPRATYQEIRGAGHVPYLSHPDEFNAILGDFLERVG
jgi:pimeloyl-ACP methyl ester carboxylesterase